MEVVGGGCGIVGVPDAGTRGFVGWFGVVVGVVRSHAGFQGGVGRPLARFAREVHGGCGCCALEKKVAETKAAGPPVSEARARARGMTMLAEPLKPAMKRMTASVAKLGERAQPALAIV